MPRDVFRWHVQQMRQVVARAAADAGVDLDVGNVVLGRVWSTLTHLATEAEATASADHIDEELIDP
jgi:hypothetical protein